MSFQKTKVLFFRSLLFIGSQKQKINIEFIEMNAYGNLFPGNLIQHTAEIFPKLNIVLLKWESFLLYSTTVSDDLMSP